MNLDLKSFKQDKNKALNFLIIAIAIIAALFIYANFAKKAASLKNQKEAELKKNELAVNISSLEKQVNKYKESLNKKDIGKLINLINSKAQEAGLRMLSLKPLAMEETAGYSKYSFEISLSSSSYGAIGKFVSGLESSPEVFMVEEISIRSLSGSQESSRAPGDTAKKDRVAAELKISTIIIK